MRQVRFPTLDEMLEGKSFEPFATNALIGTSRNGEILKDEAQGIAGKVFPGTLFESVEIFEQSSGVNPGRIILLRKKVADIGEQLQAGRESVGLFGRENPDEGEDGPG